MCSDRLCFTKVEICYPASEILSGGWIFFGCLQFTTLLMITHFGQLWVWFWLWNSVSSLIGWWITDDGPPMQFFKNNKWKRYGMGSLAFLIVFAFPGVGSSWLNYMLPASRSPCIFKAFPLLTITYTLTFKLLFSYNKFTFILIPNSCLHCSRILLYKALKNHQWRCLRTRTNNETKSFIWYCHFHSMISISSI